MRKESFGKVRLGAIVVLVIGLVLSVGCAQSEEAPASETSAPAAVMKLPVSLNEVMVALVNHAADPIWVAAWHSPETDEDWRELERLAYQLEMAGALLVIPGTGPMDEQWTSDPEWTKYSDQLRDAGKVAVAAARDRSVEEISHAGDVIVEVCEACHFEFKPDMPTGGKFGELSPNEADLEDEN